MTLLVPNAKFSIGKSTTETSDPVDMSLDDMIKSRRKEQAPRRSKTTTRTTTTRLTASSRSSTRAATTAHATAVQKSVGRGRANRQAAVNARRGISSNAKPTAMEIENEIYKQQRKMGPASTQQQPGRRSRRVADVKAKAKTNKAAQKKAAQQPSRPPTKKAIIAAKSAMSKAGFQVPKDMQMVISFAPKPDQKQGKGGGGGNKKGDTTKGGNKQGGSKSTGGGGRKKN